MSCPLDLNKYIRTELMTLRSVSSNCVGVTGYCRRSDVRTMSISLIVPINKAYPYFPLLAIYKSSARGHTFVIRYKSCVEIGCEDKSCLNINLLCSIFVLIDNKIHLTRYLILLTFCV